MDKIEELKKLKALLDTEAITQEEFNALKDEILSKGRTELNSESHEDENSNFTEQNNVDKQKGSLNISYEGRWFLIDAKTKLHINGQLHSTHSTKKGFSVDVPIESDALHFKVTVGGIKSTVYELTNLNNNSNYHFELIFDTTWGKYSDKYKLKENGQNIS